MCTAFEVLAVGGRSGLPEPVPIGTAWANPDVFAVTSDGRRVSRPGEEGELYRYPAIHEAVVLPVPDELLGSRPRAVAVADGPGGLTREEVLDHCRQRLSAYMVPDVAELRAALPRTSSGKIDRAGLAGHGA